MKKKLMAILMATLMLGTLFAVPAMAESNVILYEPFNADFPGTAATPVYAVKDPTTPEGEEPTNYCLPIRNSQAEGRLTNACITFKYTDSDGKEAPFPAGVYKLSFRAYSTVNEYTCIAFFTTGSASTSTYPTRLWMNFRLDPKTVKDTWVDYSYYFYVPEKINGEDFSFTNAAVGFDNQQTMKDGSTIYYDDLKLESVTEEFVYTSEENYKQGTFNPGSPEIAVGAYRGIDVDALSGQAERIRPVFFGRSADYGEKATVLHAVYEIAGGKERLYSVEIADVTKNDSNILVSDDKVIDIPAKTADKSYVLKSFIWDSMSGLKPMGGVSTLSLAQTE